MSISKDTKYIGRLQTHGRRSKTLAIVVHHSGDGGGASIESVINTLNTRKNKKGRTLYLGYHYIIDRDGKAFQMVADDNSIMYHASEANPTTIGISLLGAERNLKEVQIKTAVDLIIELQQKYGLPRVNVYGHGEIENRLKNTYSREGGKEPNEGLTVASRVRGMMMPPSDALYQQIIEGYSGRGTAGVLLNAESTSGNVISTIGQPNIYQNITPYIASLDSLHPNIQYELTRRRISANTADVYMPFVKLTSLVNVLGENVPGGKKGEIVAWCPSLGIHGEKASTFNATYLSLNNRSTIGYALEKIRGENKPTKVSVIVDESAENSDPPNIPMPGITDITAERGTSGPMGVRGGLTKAELKIAAYSVGQVDALLRYFLRPATRVVLEWGRTSANGSQPTKPFDWYQSADDISNLFKRLIRSSAEQTKFIEQYIYDNFGNYEILIGYVVKFDLKVNKNNVYEISLTIHSVQQFEIPTRHTGVKSLCADSVDKCAAMDIQEYFDDTYSWKQKTFKKLMAREETAIQEANRTKKIYQWNGHIIPIRDPNPDAVPSQANSAEAGTKQAEYFVSWQFFIDVIMNDEKLGILGLIDGKETQDIVRTGLLKPTRDKIILSGSNSTVYLGNNRLLANEAGYHPDLRSTNPEVMIIYNESAQKRRTSEDSSEYKLVVDLAISDSAEREVITRNTFVEQSIKQSKVGSFKNNHSAQNRVGVGTLFNGVWLNTKAIKQAFMSADTVSAAIESLLMMMNTATEGYWNLQLYSVERPNPGMFVIDYGVSKPLVRDTDGDDNFPWIDKEENEQTRILDSVNKINLDRYRKSRDNQGKNQPRYIYMFNRRTKILSDNSAEIGSDIIDLKVEFNLPQVIAVQAIAGVGGSAQKSTLQSIDIPELNKISLIKDIFPTCLTDKPDSPCPDNSPCRDENLRTLEERIRSLETAPLGAATVLGLPSPKINLQDQSKKSFWDIAFENIAIGNDQTGTAEEIRSRNIQYTQLQQTLNKLKAERAYGSTAVVDKIRELSGLGTTLDLIEFNPAKMMKKININSRNAENGYEQPYVHAFNSSNLTKTIVSVTLPGIGGIELFQSFLVDRVPSILERGFYVVTKVTHKFSSSDGWLTTIEGRFRYRPSTKKKGKPLPDCYKEPSLTFDPVTGEIQGGEGINDPGAAGDTD